MWFISFSVFFGRARKSPKCENRHTLQAKTCFFKIRAGTGLATGKATDDPIRHQKYTQLDNRACQNIVIFLAIGVNLKNTSQNDLPELPREPPGTLPGRPRWSREALRALQDESKSRQEGRKSRPHAVSEWPGRPPGANLAPKSPSEAFRMPFWPSRGSILAPAGFDFGGRPRPAQERPGSFGKSMLGQC